ncbi:hypothetical protein PHYSODRAFT_246040 [Phytophthora sojae]|uniref:Uncharacterized protein n=1 Tax=Phytophthora sojae (strain P6497) TaxID=1094619 RepID=G4Z7F6_PHYSP|nr:hypothetical protein PHYSODRAFT_246040 [Phytophthora sojae]EGZ20359.1 hypothetical protein PHYSODRAFT_246040 [Phytophthora sojae]|eukprot:XP_009523076.1 hypothetical protein PHYSODRAFT_246040 [Phytophthora sojae]
MLSLPHSTDAENSVVVFWDKANFAGNAVQVRRAFMGQTCYNDNVGKPSSITWKNLPTTGRFEGKSKIAFYSERSCKGIVKAWFTTGKDFPTNLALDGLNDNVKSFMLWQINEEPRVYQD